MSGSRQISLAAGLRLRDSYEALRNRAVEQRDTGSGDCLGQALLEQRGMAAWMKVRRQNVSPEPEAPRPETRQQTWRPPASHEVVGVLARMILSCAREVART